MASWNVIQAKLYKGERLTVEEIKRVNTAFEEFNRSHAVWIEHPNIWECSNCKFWIMRPDVIEAYHYCPRCGAKMELALECNRNGTEQKLAEDFKSIELEGLLLDDLKGTELEALLLDEQ